MKYIDSFHLPSFDKEARYEFPTKYPFSLYSSRGLFDIYFSNITIFYGGNGSGKSTLLNLINSKLNLQRKSSFYHDETFDEYVKMCRIKKSWDDDLDKEKEIPDNSKIIASEDIFNYILKIRDKNIKTEENVKKYIDEYQEAKFSKYNYRSLKDIDKLSLQNEARRVTQSEFIRRRTSFIKQFSNGENVLRYFDSELENDGIYLLDEPENSLSPKFQLELLQLLIDCSRYCDCQFIIATHSPFLLSIPGAKIYNLDLEVVETREWTELENVRMYYNFFKKYKDDFEK